jgi:hypothetical protein
VTWWLSFHLHPIEVDALLATRSIMEESVMDKLAAGATVNLRTVCAHLRTTAENRYYHV